MKTLNELREYYNSELMPDLKKLEGVRLANVRKMVVMIGPTLAVGGLLALVLHEMEDLPSLSWC